MKNQFKKFPAFGKRIMEARLAGEVPNNSVVVAFDWDTGKSFPRVVIDDGIPAESIELRYLAGLDVIIAYHDKHASRVLDMARAILKVNPRILHAFAIDIPTTLILKHSNGEVMI
jgi:hypothetical protein